MNRNVESHFAQVPTVEIQRSKFDRSHSVKTSLSVGDLVPFLCEEIVPGDTFDITTSKVVRSQTMLAPIMDNIFLDTYYFFVPSRLVWDSFKAFCGENTAGAWAPTVEYTIPTLASPEGGFQSGTLADYFGLPVGVEWSADDELAPSALPFRCYALICQEFFRDQNLTDPLLIPKGDANQQGVNSGNYITDVANGGFPFKVAKYHDVFTSCLPSPQKSVDPVGIPIDIPMFAGGVFPVTTGRDVSDDATMYPMVVKTLQTPSGTSNDFNDLRLRSVNSTANGYWNQSAQTPAAGSMSISTVNPLSGYYGIAPANLQVDIPAQASGSGNAQVEFTVNELRLAFAYQRFLEKMARGGSRYRELLLNIYGVNNGDARMAVPEYLGGNRVPINVSEVTNSTEVSGSFLGDLGAKSHTSDTHRDVLHSFSEHGYLIGCMCLRTDHTYAQGLERFWTRKKFLDFYNPGFAHLGEIPVYQAEIYATSDNMASKDRVFGYQEYAYDYRFKKNMATGEMRPGVNNSLSHWTLTDYYTDVPSLSDEWIRETPNNLDRCLAVSSSVAHQFWADIYVKNFATRPMPMFSVPGLLDHF